MADDKQQHKEQPIIIKKVKKGGGHGAHGGAWKVAYADFVTAMMAFFIVMWILASSEKVKQQVAEYFQHPERFEMFSGERKTGPLPVDIDLGRMVSSKKGDGNSKNDPLIKFDQRTTDTLFKKLLQQAAQDSVEAAKRVEKVSEEVKKMFEKMVTEKPEMQKILSSIKIEMTKEGLRIELIESTESLFFEVGSANLRPEARELLKSLGAEIGKLPNFVEIEGHTDSRGYKAQNGYSNWNLSSDRANSARYVIENNGLWEGQVIKVTGYSDKKLRNPENPFDSSNRRVSILIKQISANQFLPDTTGVK
jgi:chemotaxis protein MotB